MKVYRSPHYAILKVRRAVRLETRTEGEIPSFGLRLDFTSCAVNEIKLEGLGLLAADQATAARIHKRKEEILRLDAVKCGSVVSRQFIKDNCLGRDGDKVTALNQLIDAGIIVSARNGVRLNPEWDGDMSKIDRGPEVFEPSDK